MDPAWLLVARMASGLRRVVDNIEFSIPPLDDLAFEIRQARWYLDQIESQIREKRRGERKTLISLVFGSTMPKEKT